MTEFIGAGCGGGCSTIGVRWRVGVVALLDQLIEDVNCCHVEKGPCREQHGHASDRELNYVHHLPCVYQHRYVIQDHSSDLKSHYCRLPATLIGR